MIIGASLLSLLILSVGTIFFPQNIVMSLAETSTFFMALRVTLLMTIVALAAAKWLQIKLPRWILAGCAVAISSWAIFSLYTFSINILDFLSLVLVALAFIVAMLEQKHPKEPAQLL